MIISMSFCELSQSPPPTLGHRGRKMPPSLNTSNPAVKRILSEVKKMQTDPSDQFEAHPVEDDLFDWHFVLRGPADTPFEGGIYHGRIILPPQYPYKPPEFMFLCPQGRFEVGKKICLTISQHHPEMWQPSWDIRTALTAIQSFMPSPGNGAIAALDYNDAERRSLASKSKEATRATLTAHSMLDAFADFLDAPPPAAAGAAAAAGGARREATADGAGAPAAVEISSPAPQQSPAPASSAAEAPVFSPKPREERQAAQDPDPPSAAEPPRPPPPDPQASASAPATPTPTPTPTPTATPSNPSGTSTEARPSAAAAAGEEGAAGAGRRGTGEEGGGRRPAYAPSTYAPARAAQAQAPRTRAGEGEGRGAGGGRGLQRERSGRSMAAAAAPSDDEILLGNMALTLILAILALAARRAAVTFFPDVQWLELAQGLVQEVLLLVQELFSEAPASSGEL